MCYSYRSLTGVREYETMTIIRDAKTHETVDSHWTIYHSNGLTENKDRRIGSWEYGYEPCRSTGLFAKAAELVK